ncbi:MAG: hypothetical protein JXC33_01395 [Deltaproteobacteria bacterium]|nr:hypothetical protein [Deltaproteobacteria bacterium]
MREKSYDLTQEEILRERALVLARAGDSVDRALKKMKAIEKIIADKEHLLNEAIESRMNGNTTNHDYAPQVSPEKLVSEINKNIFTYNKMREYAKLRYYYFIVTREAMGFRRHKMVEDIYRIPSKKQPIQRR